MDNREEKFERMLADTLKQYHEIIQKMDELKSEGKVKTVTYRQMMTEKLKCQSILAIYKAYGLIEEY